MVEWVTPQYKRSEVDRAGRVLVDSTSSGDQREEALEVVNNWRSAHAFPLNTFQVGLRDAAWGVGGKFLIAQRIKRLPSIKSKLERFSTMKLSQMQDIGGCRAVVDTCEKVFAFETAYKRSKRRHRLVHEDNYIAQPRDSGYRGVHLIYRYHSDRKPTFNDLKIEVQLRSVLQHAWATTVETVGTFLQQSLKASQGTPAWLRFFCLMGSAIAVREGTVIVPGTPSSEDGLVAEIRRFANELNVKERLEAYRVAIRGRESGDERYFLLDLRPSKGIVTVAGFRGGELEKATAQYLDVEKTLTGPGDEAVLVSVDSLEKLRAAYPNYFLDTKIFLNILDEVLA